MVSRIAGIYHWFTCYVGLGRIEVQEEEEIAEEEQENQEKEQDG